MRGRRYMLPKILVLKFALIFLDMIGDQSDGCDCLWSWDGIIHHFVQNVFLHSFTSSVKNEDSVSKVLLVTISILFIRLKLVLKLGL